MGATEGIHFAQRPDIVQHTRKPGVIDGCTVKTGSISEIPANETRALQMMHQFRRKRVHNAVQKIKYGLNRYFHKILYEN